MSINGLSSLGGASPVNPLSTNRLTGPSAKPALSFPRGSDSVELSSDVSRYLNVIKSNDVRADKVTSIRAALEAGTYEDDYKLDVAADRLLEDLA